MQNRIRSARAAASRGVATPQNVSGFGDDPRTREVLPLAQNGSPGCNIGRAFRAEFRWLRVGSGLAGKPFDIPPPPRIVLSRNPELK